MRGPIVGERPHCGRVQVTCVQFICVQLTCAELSSVLCFVHYHRRKTWQLAAGVALRVGPRPFFFSSFIFIQIYDHGYLEATVDMDEYERRKPFARDSTSPLSRRSFHGIGVSRLIVVASWSGAFGAFNSRGRRNPC